LGRRCFASVRPQNTAQPSVGAFTRENLPAGTLRATYIATNPVQAFIDPKSGEVRGPGADIAREIARLLNAAVKITGAAGPAAPAGVIDSVKKGEADIGFLAFDPLRSTSLRARISVKQLRVRCCGPAFAIAI
jgi:ABC-type amino acid transport substrate-binding protein